MQALYQWRMAAADPDDIAAEFRASTHGGKSGGKKKVDWDYFDALFPAITANRDKLLGHIAPLLDRDTESLTPVEWAILLLSCYELAERDDVPGRVVINEAVELAKGYGATGSYKYINAVLDKLSHQLRPTEQ